MQVCWKVKKVERLKILTRRGAGDVEGGVERGTRKRFIWFILTCEIWLLLRVSLPCGTEKWYSILQRELCNLRKWLTALAVSAR